TPANRNILDNGRPVFSRTSILAYGQKDAKLASPAWLAFHLHETAVLFHNAIDCGQSQPCPLPGFLGCKKGLEDPFTNAGVHSDARIADGEDSEPPRLENCVVPAFLFGEFGTVRLDAQAPSFWHGVTGIDAKIR